MPTKRANHPLCPFCGEDQAHLVEAVTDGGRARRTVTHCSTCGKSWDRVDDCEHGYWFGCPHCRRAKAAEPKRVTRDGYFDGREYHVESPQDY